MTWILDLQKKNFFLSLRRHDLLVSDLRIFLPFTINLDPYFRKVLKEDQQAMEDEGIIMPMKAPLPHPIRHHLPNKPHSSMQSNIFNSLTNSGAQSDASNKFGDLSRRPSVIGNAPVHIDKSMPASFDLMASFPVSYFFFLHKEMKVWNFLRLIVGWIFAHSFVQINGRWCCGKWLDKNNR